MHEFKAEDIKAGYLGVLENGKLVIAMEFIDQLMFITKEQFVNGKGGEVETYKAFNQNSCVDGYNLVALYGYPKNLVWFSTENRPLLWECTENVEMTVSEIEKKLGIKNLKIVKE